MERTSQCGGNRARTGGFNGDKDRQLSPAARRRRRQIGGTDSSRVEVEPMADTRWVAGGMAVYRGREGMWSWVLHRVTGVGVLVFLFAHVLDTVLVGWGPEVYNSVVGIYHVPVFRVLEVVLVGAVIYHAVNGLRIILIDFWDAAADYQRQLTVVTAVVTLLLFVPAAVIMLRPLFRGG